VEVITVAEQLAPSLDDLIHAFKEPGRPNYLQCRKLYVELNGTIRETYFAKRIHAGALIIKPHGPVPAMTQKRKIHLRYDGLVAAAVQPEFEAAIWRTRALERQSGLILGGRSRKVLVEMLYSILVYLIGVLDATIPTEDAPGRSDRRRRIESALGCATAELERLEAFARDAARRASLRWYLLGLPVGALVGIGFITTADRWSSTLVGAPSEIVKVCFACGAVGGIVSVMTRITMGQRLSIDSQQGHSVTLLAGGFRPLIGAVFGVAIYAFIEGGLLPIAVPASDSVEVLFFASLAFLAGFSERWAQDTIVQSATLAAKARSGSRATAADPAPDVTTPHLPPSPAPSPPVRRMSLQHPVLEARNGDRRHD
jgi:hypothetical protein